ncbi:MAG TPA: universal stress protein, partial [Hyphomicrobiaceae bacterium]|nr:universal stress protein [Hyphomicrobiaceae bacterium]
GRCSVEPQLLVAHPGCGRHAGATSGRPPQDLLIEKDVAMALKTILLHLTDPGRATRLIAAAVPLARAAGAHLVGLSVLPPYIVMPAADGGGTSITMDEHRISYMADMARMKRAFLEATADLPRPSEWREADAAFSSVSDAVLDHVRAADLVIASQPDPKWGGSPLTEDPVRLVMEGGRPVLLIPARGDVRMPPSRVAVAWDGRREAARAAFDAIPLAVLAGNVTIISVNGDRAGRSAGDLPTAEIAAALARHGAKADSVDATARGGDVGHELLRQAHAHGADLLVMGCYGHSRLRELVLGGATRDVLAGTDMPILMSH